MKPLLEAKSLASTLARSRACIPAQTLNGRLGVIPVLVGLAALGGCHHGVPMTLRTAIVRSNFIFEGSVQQVGGSTLPDYLRAPQGSLVVRVTRALAEGIQEFEQQSVTVILTPDSPIRPQSIRVGQTLVFTANPLVYADTLGVEGQAHRPSAQVIQQAGRRPQLLLEDRVRVAQVIVEGTVRSVEKLTEEKRYTQPRPRLRQARDSEHDPEWMRATVNVRAVLRGDKLREIDVYFPGSRDVVWYGFPRFRVDQTGTWLLHREPIEQGAQPRLVALDPLDFQEASGQGEAIRALAGGKRRAPRAKEKEVR